MTAKENRLMEILRHLDEEIKNDSHSCIIASEGGHADESLFIGTKDAYLNLAKALISLVAGSEISAESFDVEYLSDKQCFWSDEVKYAIYNAPGWGCFIHSSYLAKDQADVLRLVKLLSHCDDADMMSMENDPAFYDP